MDPKQASSAPKSADHYDPDGDDGPGYGYGEYGYGNAIGQKVAVLSFHQLIRMIRVYWGTLAVGVGAILAIGTFLTLLVPDRYTGEAKVLVLADQVNIINLEAITTGVTGDLAGLMSEIEMVRSLEVSQRVLDGLGPDGQLRLVTARNNADDFSMRVDRAMGKVSDQFGGLSGAAAESGIAAPGTVLAARPDNLESWIEDLPADESLLVSLGPDEIYLQAAAIIDRNLRIDQIGRSRVISIKVTAPEPRIAADIANRFAKAYIGAQIQAKFDAARRANSLLNEQLFDLRKQIADQEREIEDHRAKSGLTNEDAVELAAERVEQLNQTLTSARAELAAIQARKLEVENARNSRSLIESTADVLQSGLIEQLRVREIELERESSTLQDRLLPSHPDVTRVQRELSQLRGRIAAEIEKVVNSISSEENTLRAEIEVLSRTLQTAEATVVDLNRSEREMDALSMELQANRSLLETFVARTRETEIQEDFQQADAQIIAEAQMARSPSGPNRPLFIALSFIAALGAGGLSVLLREMLNPRLRSLDAIREIVEIPLLGILPDLNGLLRRDNGQVLKSVRSNPSAPISDLIRRAYLRLSTAQNIAPAAIKTDPEMPNVGRVVLVTSSRPSEGKTSISCSLAFTAARFGKRVIIVDCDLRKPGIARAMGQNHDLGIVDFLTQEADVNQIVHCEQPSGVYYITRGSRTEAPAELIEYGGMKPLIQVLREYYDFVILDSAPVLAAPETRQLARLADQILYVLNWAVTKRSEFASAIGEIVDVPRFHDRASLMVNQVPHAEMKFLELPLASYLSYYRYSDYGAHAKRSA